MFATLLGPYPVAARPDAAAELDELALDVVAELDSAGLEPLSDGQVRRGAGTLPDDPAALAGEWRFAAASTSRAVKQAVPGPYSLAWSADGHGGAGRVRRGRVGRTATAIEQVREAIEALVAAGCPFIEVEEPAAIQIGDDPSEGRRFREAHRALTDGLEDVVHLSLVLTGGNVDAAGAATFFDLPYASYAFDLIAGPDNWRLIAEAPGDRGIICGALDPAAASSDRPEVLVWAAHYAASTGGRGLVRVGLANASSLAGLSPERARAKVHALADAARIAAVGSTEELAAALDPRAVDIRSAAYGRYVPPPPARRLRR
jgi:methionine synthase II (cobalamin-independent)